MRRLLVLLAVSAVLLLSVAASHADALVNPGFETGDTTGWIQGLSGGSINVVTGWSGSTLTYAPREGQHFLVIGGGSANNRQYVVQAVNLQAGDLLQGYAAFDAHDYLPFNDWAAVEVYNSSSVLLATPWRSDVATVGSLASGPWTYWSWSPGSAGSYLLLYSSTNNLDGALASYGLFDTTPEPGTMALLLMGLPMAALLRRRRG